MKTSTTNKIDETSEADKRQLAAREALEASDSAIAKAKGLSVIVARMVKTMAAAEKTYTSLRGDYVAGLQLFLKRKTLKKGTVTADQLKAYNAVLKPQLLKSGRSDGTCRVYFTRIKNDEGFEKHAKKSAAAIAKAKAAATKKAAQLGAGDNNPAHITFDLSGESEPWNESVVDGIASLASNILPVDVDKFIVSVNRGLKKAKIAAKMIAA